MTRCPATCGLMVQGLERAGFAIETKCTHSPGGLAAECCDFINRIEKVSTRMNRQKRGVFYLCSKARLREFAGFRIELCKINAFAIARRVSAKVNPILVRQSRKSPAI